MSYKMTMKKKKKDEIIIIIILIMIIITQSHTDSSAYDLCNCSRNG